MDEAVALFVLALKESEWVAQRRAVPAGLSEQMHTSLVPSGEFSPAAGCHAAVARSAEDKH